MEKVLIGGDEGGAVDIDRAIGIDLKIGDIGGGVCEVSARRSRAAFRSFCIVFHCNWLWLSLKNVSCLRCHREG